MTPTPSAQCLHIGIYGRRNSGKSSLINALTGQDIALVSDTPGTTTDPVSKAMELASLGPCLITDTAGYDDEGDLGLQRVERTRRTLERADMAIVLISPAEVAHADYDLERQWLSELSGRRIPHLIVLGKSDLRPHPEDDLKALVQCLESTAPAIAFGQHDPTALERLIQGLTALVPADFGQQSITGRLAQAGDVVLLVMPQDQSAPKGRLILPQVQTIRELLDKGCTIVSCTPDTLVASLEALAQPPHLIITDSQAFATVYPLKPEGTLLTSFSVLFAAYKGDIDLFVEGAKALDSLRDGSRVLIAEACTHAPATEDIGRVKIPALLRKRYGQGLQIEVISGSDYPTDLSVYDIIIHCGACMFNRAHVLSRVARAEAQAVPVTNYGICLAYLTGILDKIAY